MNILGVYRITYPSYNNMTQEKNLVSHEDYMNVVRHLKELVTQIANFDKKADTSGFSALLKEFDKESKLVKTELAKQFGDEFFTDQSPLFLSQNTNGAMSLPKWQGGIIEVKLEKLH